MAAAASAVVGHSAGVGGGAGPHGTCQDGGCMDCGIHPSLLRSSSSSRRPRQPPTNSHTSIVNRHVLQHQHSFRHPHNDQRYMTLDSRHRSRRRSRPQSSRNVYHGSYGHLLEDEDLLQQCLATLVMDAAILRQQQQLQQEQLQIQQQQLQQQQSVIQQQQQQAETQQRTAAVTAAPADHDGAMEAGAATDTQSVIESIAGDAAATTLVTVDRIEVSVEMEEPDRDLNQGSHSSDESIAC